MCFIVVVMLLNAGIEKDNDVQSATGEQSTKEKLFRIAKLIITPSLVCSIIALIMAMVGYQGVSLIADTVETVGNMTTPAALIIIGIALSEMPVKDMFTNVKADIVSVISVLVTPLIIYLIFNPFAGNDALLIGEAVIIAGMPVATAGTMLCVEYGGDEKLMAQMTFISTVLSIVTIPLLAVFLGR